MGTAQNQYLFHFCLKSPSERKAFAIIARCVSLPLNGCSSHIKGLGATEYGKRRLTQPLGLPR
jgi:hypothetical protein